ncbi:MAG: glycoside hydrolase family 3 N-terminal domain-containing protein [Haloarculaceae archaeon]
MATDGDEATYRQDDAAVSRRVEDLLDRMTIAEKAGQLVGTWAGQFISMQDLENVKEYIREYNLGVAAPFGWGGAYALEPENVVDAANELQRTAVEETRLGVPLMFNADSVHGAAYIGQSTILPNGLGAAATWDPETVEAGAGVTAAEMRACGGHQNYSPTCDVGREIRWGRVFETFGESPYLVAQMAAAKVRGYQGDDLSADDAVVATGKHFPAYSEPDRGEDAAPIDVSEHKLRNTLTPAFEAAIDAGVESIMPSYASNNGEPCHASRNYLTDLLRGEMGFDGHVVSDWGGVRHLHEEHRTARDWRESIYQTRRAGLDIASVDSVGHVERLIDLVESGDLDESVLDDAVARVLDVKFRLGLFEDPYVETETALETLGRDEHREIAYEAASTSMTLLKNDDLLPLSGGEDVFLGGPNADDLVHQVGGWSVDREELVDGPSIRDAIAEHAGSVTYEQGTTLNEELDVEAAAEKAAEADVAVLALGEGWYLHEFGPSAQAGQETGEWPTRSNVHLSDAQRSLVQAVHETGTPVVGVLVTGRPLIVDWMAEHVPAILMAYYPGTEGGRAVADTLFGDNEPRGRLPISIPKSHGDLPQHHDYRHQPRPLGAEAEHPDSYDPLYAFGHGLSYTDFEYRGLELSETEIGPGERVTAEVTVANVGDRHGEEVVQAFATQECATRVRENRSLVAFDRVSLDPGEERTVELEIEAEDCGYYHVDEGHVVEADDYTVRVEEFEAQFAVDGTYL